MARTTDVITDTPIVAYARRPAIRSAVFEAIWLIVFGGSAVVGLLGLAGRQAGMSLAILLLSIVFGLPVLLQTVARHGRQHRKTPSLIIDDAMVIDRRSGGDPIDFKAIVSAEILYSGKFGAVGLQLCVDRDVPQLSSLLRRASSLLLLVPWRRGRRICVPCTSLDQPSDQLAFAIVKKLKVAGVKVETKSPWYLPSETHD